MISLEPCRGCGRPLIHHRVANLAVRLEPSPLDLNGIMGELAASRPLWMVDEGKVRPARPGEPGPLREHRCPVSAQTAIDSIPPRRSEPLSRPSSPPQVLGGDRSPKVPQAGVQSLPAAPSTPSSARPTASSSVPAAGRPPFEVDVGAPRTHPCDTCQQPVALDGGDGYMAAQLGATIMWAAHTVCPER